MKGPLASVTAIVLASACRPPIVGEWSLVSMDDAGESTAYPVVYESTEEGAVQRIVNDASLSVRQNGPATFTTTCTYTSGEAEPEVDVFPFDLVGTKISRTRYRFTSDEQGIAFDCTVARDMLTCSTEESVVAEFTRAE